MLIALLATLMFFAMLAATFNAMRKEMSEARIVVDQQRRPASRPRTGTAFGTRPW